MIKRRNNSYGLNTNVNLDPSSTSNASPNITNHIYIREIGSRNGSSANLLKPEKESMSDAPSALRNQGSDSVITRDVSIEGEEKPLPSLNPQKIYAREVIINAERNEPEVPQKVFTVEEVILETYAKILLDQNKALMCNLVSKNTIIVPVNDLEQIICAKVGKKCEVILEDSDGGCCVAKYSPIKKVESIKIIDDEMVIDFKQVYNSEWNDLVNNHHLCLRFAVE